MHWYRLCNMNIRYNCDVYLCNLNVPVEGVAWSTSASVTPLSTATAQLHFLHFQELLHALIFTVTSFVDMRYYSAVAPHSTTPTKTNNCLIALNDNHIVNKLFQKKTKICIYLSRKFQMLHMLLYSYLGFRMIGLVWVTRQYKTIEIIE